MYNWMLQLLALLDMVNTHNLPPYHDHAKFTPTILCSISWWDEKSEKWWVRGKESHALLPLWKVSVGNMQRVKSLVDKALPWQLNKRYDGIVRLSDAVCFIKQWSTRKRKVISQWRTNFPEIGSNYWKNQWFYCKYFVFFRKTIPEVLPVSPHYYIDHSKATNTHLSMSSNACIIRIKTPNYLVHSYSVRNLVTHMHD